MNIVHINSLYAPYQIGGAEKSVQILAEAQAALGHRVTVLCTAPEGEAREESRAGVAVRYLPVRNLHRPFTGAAHGGAAKALWHLVDSWNPMMAGVVRRHLGELRPEVVNSHTVAGFSAAVWGAVKSLGIPLVHTLRDYYLACPRSTMFRDGHNCERPCGDCRFYAAPRRSQSARVDAVVGNSRFILDRHLALGYFPNAAIREVIYSGQQAPEAIPPRPSCAGRAMVFGYIGQIQPVKGVEMLIDAFAKLGDEAELRIAGRIDNDFARALAARSTSNVKWLGWQAPAELFAEVDAVIVPSLWHEPLPRAAIEAAMHGVTVIGSNRGGFPEIAASIGGRMFDPDRADSLSAALQAVIGSGWEATACGKIVGEFVPADRAGDYLSLYARAIDRCEA